MKRNRFVMPLLFLGIFALLTAILMWLWNWLMPFIFNLPVINYWQSIGIVIMSKIIFGGHHFGRSHNPRFHRHHDWHHKFLDKIDDDNKERLRKRMEAINKFWSDLDERTNVTHE